MTTSPGMTPLELSGCVGWLVQVDKDGTQVLAILMAAGDDFFLKILDAARCPDSSDPFLRMKLTAEDVAGMKVVTRYVLSSHIDVSERLSAAEEDKSWIEKSSR